MALSISSDAILEKNKLEGAGPWAVLLDISVPGVDDNIRVTTDNVNTVFNGNTYVPFPFKIAEISDTESGEVPRVDLSISNVSRAIEAYIQEYDYYCKINGYVPIEVTIMVVNLDHLGNTEPEVEYLYELKKPQTDPVWATFTLGASNPFNRRFPLNRLMKNRCRVKVFKSFQCGYTGTETTCDRSLARCRELGNSSRYGGFPGIGAAPVFI